MTISPTAPEDFATDVATIAYLGDSGIVLGQTDEVGVRWVCTSADPWGAKPAPREQTGDRAYDNGQWDATRFYGPRVFELAGNVHAPDHGALHWARQRLHNAIGVTPSLYRVIEPGFDGYAMVRQQGDLLWSEITPTLATFSMSLFAANPLIYSSLEHTFDLAFPIRSGGLTWPATWPATWTGTVIYGSEVLTNDSPIAVGLNMVATGPVDNLRIVNSTTGKALVINNPNGSTLTAGQYLTIDTARHELLLMGSASRRGWASGDWPVLEPGDNTLAITGDSTTGASHLSGAYRVVRL